MSNTQLPWWLKYVDKVMMGLQKPGGNFGGKGPEGMRPLQLEGHTERISARKYPGYAAYQRATARIVPWTATTKDQK